MDDPQPALPEIDSDDERLCYTTDNCDQIRRKINNFINAGEMKVGEFQQAIGVSPDSYRSFLKQSGKDKGSLSDTYACAARFFKKRELQGLKPPRKTAKRTGTAGTGGSKSKEAVNKYDVSSIQLEGEKDTAVPVYDTCDIVRRKIRAYLRDPAVTQAAFLREIATTFPEPKKLKSSSLNTFVGKSGSNAGSTSQIFYAAYVFFEKLRVRDGKPKTSFREQMERVWGSDGFDLRTSSNTQYCCFRGERPYTDEYGKVTINGH